MSLGSKAWTTGRPKGKPGGGGFWPVKTWMMQPKSGRLGPGAQPGWAWRWVPKRIEIIEIIDILNIIILVDFVLLSTHVDIH
jgi:hypothetical protein